MKRFLIIFLLVVFFSGCATILFPSRLLEQPENTLYQFDYGMCVVDIVLWGIAGVLYDIVTGALWIPYPPEQEIE